MRKLMAQVLQNIGNEMTYVDPCGFDTYQGIQELMGLWKNRPASSRTTSWGA